MLKKNGFLPTLTQSLKETIYCYSRTNSLTKKNRGFQRRLHFLVPTHFSMTVSLGTNIIVLHCPIILELPSYSCFRDSVPRYQYQCCTVLLSWSSLPTHVSMTVSLGTNIIVLHCPIIPELPSFSCFHDGVPSIQYRINYNLQIYLRWL